MKKKSTLLIIIIVLVAVIAAASFAYNKLSANNSAQNIIGTGETVENETLPPDTEDTPNPEDTSNSSSTAEEAPTIDFVVEDRDGNLVFLSDFRGKPVVLNFWASWCGPCKAEMPDFEEMHKEYGDQIHFVMVNATDGSRETVETAASFIDGQGYSFPIYFDTTLSASYTFGASSLPSSFFIDAEGNVIAKAIGSINKNIIQQGIDMIYAP